MARYFSSETRSYIRLVLGTLSAMALISGLNILIILNSVGSEIFKPLQRNIASVAKAEKKDKTQVPPLTITIDCKNKGSILKKNTKAGSLRLLFKECDKLSRPLNQSNQSQADLFLLKKRTWTSDFIALSPGKNKVSFQLGKESQVIDITRDIPKDVQTNKAL